ncbi:membrane fusion protein, cobalt-zinc-cadmium efflux system [Nitrosomonas eutropha]|uniref:efflux RND transporter periplasmic adaptor subunit n=1 Tax=Nitrosomonas eutropha TaxID=916 RepID=UPI00089C0252|nr:efflux RND transporter periplasmic adaptor subunit [Nitrosomonas eutropha]SDW23404.1 membrane fusion protein, cobalt-zinc-cadmium efflux system [Nitrosomonas eutropha]
MNVSGRLPIAAVILVGILLGALLLIQDKSSLPDAEELPHSVGSVAEHQSVIGPKGGELFSEDDLGLELTIHEGGTFPRFRLYLYRQKQPLAPTEVKVTIALSRLGRPAQLFHFRPESDYLVSDQEVEEPHSFEMVIVAEYQDKTYRWHHSEVEARMEMSDTAMQNNGIELATAGPAVIRSKITLPGEIIFNEHNIVHVVPRLPGMVVSIKRHHGQKVKKGEVLAIMESAMLADLRSQYLLARKRLVLAQTIYDREEQLWREKITAKQDYLVAQQQREEASIATQLAAERLRALGVQPESGLSWENIAHYEIRSPISGIVIDEAIVTGEVVKEDKTAYIVADVSTVWAAVRVFPRNLHQVRVGQRAVIRANTYDLTREGKVIYVTTLLDEQTRTAVARVQLDNRDEQWRPGMFVKADLQIEAVEVPVAVSLEAIQTLDNQSVVFGRYGDFFEMRPLKLGRSDSQMVEVIEGLFAGEHYAAGNSFIIKSELGKAGATHEH